LTGIDYFTKWIEALPSRQATNIVVIQFLVNIISSLGFPKRIITDIA